MRTIYIGSSQNSNKKSGSMTKVYFYLFMFLIVLGTVVKMASPMLVEEWINRNGARANGYAFSIRDVDIKFGKGQLVLMDVKIFNPKTDAKLLETTQLTVQLNWNDLILSQEKKFSFSADKVDLILSKDLTTEMERIETANLKSKDSFYLNSVEGIIGNLNIIEHKDDLSRTVIELKDTNLKVKDFSPLSINKKTEFSINSNVSDGGKLALTGKTILENGKTPWSIQGSLKQVPADIFNKMAGNKLPFTFNQPSLNAEIIAESEDGKVNGEIVPDIKRLNIVDEKPGIPTQTIARALTNELTFTLPFTLKDELVLQYDDTFKKLKNYRRYPAEVAKAGPAESNVSQVKKEKKGFSFWSF